MKLEITINKNQKENISYHKGKVIIIAKNQNQIKELLNDELRIKRYIMLLSESLDNNINDVEITKETKIIKKIIKELKKAPYDINYFKEITIKIDEDNYLNYKKLLEEINEQIIIDVSNSSYQNIKDLKQINFKKEVKIYHNLNMNYITLFECEEMFEKLNEYQKEIKKLSLSPLESLLYVYDLVKKRKFKESCNEDESRSLNHILKGEYTVCLGYANLFCAIANTLEIKSSIKCYQAKKGAHHASVICYINDPKYEFKGCLEFDPTWDKAEDAHTWFGLAEDDATYEKNKYGYNTPEDYNSYTYIMNQYKRYLFSESVHYNKFIANLNLKPIIDQIISDAEKLKDKEILKELKELLNEEDYSLKVTKLALLPYTNNIPIFDFINIFINVYPNISVSNLKQTVKSRYKEEHEFYQTLGIDLYHEEERTYN